MRLGIITKKAENNSFKINFDWSSFIKGLKEINYQGIFSLETLSRKENINDQIKENKYLYEIVDNLISGEFR